MHIERILRHLSLRLGLSVPTGQPIVMLHASPKCHKLCCRLLTTVQHGNGVSLASCPYQVPKSHMARPLFTWLVDTIPGGGLVSEGGWGFVWFSPDFGKSAGPPPGGFVSSFGWMSGWALFMG